MPAVIQVLHHSAPPYRGGIAPRNLLDVVVDDEQDERVGFATPSARIGPFVRTGYRHDGDKDRGK